MGYAVYAVHRGATRGGGGGYGCAIVPKQVFEHFI